MLIQVGQGHDEYDDERGGPRKSRPEEQAASNRLYAAAVRTAAGVFRCPHTLVPIATL